MSKIIDPILLLRDYTIKQKKVRQEGEELILGATRVPLSAPTAWRKSGAEKHYTVGALWFYLSNRDAELKKYMSEAAILKVGIVSQPDKDSIVEYFTGKTDKTDCIDEEYRAETQIAKHKKPTEGAKVVLGDANKSTEEAMELGLGTEEEAKATKGGEKEQIMDYLLKNEKRLSTRHTQLLGPKVFS